MSFLEWTLWIMIGTFYICCLFTVCLVTFRKGYVGLGIVGIFLPWVWLIGALLPARSGSTYARQAAHA